MKTKILGVLCLFLGLTLMSFGQHTYQLSWTNPNATYPICNASATPPLKTWCDTGMTVGETTAAGAVVTVFTSALSPTATSYVLPTYPTPGTHTFAVAENFQDLLGNAQMTTPASATVVVPSLTGPAPDPVTGLTGSAH